MLYLCLTYLFITCNWIHNGDGPSKAEVDICNVLNVTGTDLDEALIADSW
jgi:hypothetical protein